VGTSKVTIRDVARIAGVSATTVSHALNNKGRIEPATRERVLAAAREIGYTPNPIARSLRSGKSGVIGLVLPFLAANEMADPGSSSWYALMALGAAQAALRNEHTLLMLPALDETHGLNGYPVDGLIVGSSVEATSTINELEHASLPYVTVDVAPPAKSGEGDPGRLGDQAVDLLCKLLRGESPEEPAALHAHPVTA
jgi:DNA-binding LacI/PurR family transcriptional regulator